MNQSRGHHHFCAPQCRCSGTGGVTLNVKAIVYTRWPLSIHIFVKHLLRAGLVPGDILCTRQMQVLASRSLPGSRKTLLSTLNNIVWIFTTALRGTIIFPFLYIFFFLATMTLKPILKTRASKHLEVCIPYSEENLGTCKFSMYAYI